MTSSLLLPQLGKGIHGSSFKAKSQNRDLAGEIKSMKTNNANRYNMFYGATPKIFELASELRKNMTNEEKLLWTKVRGKKIAGVSFRRQHPINIFVADFYCHEKRLVIEVDGGVHFNYTQRERDEQRDELMKEFGINVLRFSNEEIVEDMDRVIKTIKNYCKN